jgi:hypothetical protein
MEKAAAKRPPGKTFMERKGCVRLVARAVLLAFETPIPVRWQDILLLPSYDCLLHYQIRLYNVRKYGMLIIATCVMDRTYAEKVKSQMMQHQRGNGNPEDLTG